MRGGIKISIYVIDSLPGSGKTSWAIDYMNSHADENFMYITPFLDETTRIASSCCNKSFMQPQNYGFGKMESMYHLLMGEEDIAATHELFRYLDDRSIEKLQDVEYTLFLDETLNVIEPIDLKKDDLKVLKDSGCITWENDGYVFWDQNNHDYDLNPEYANIKQLALQHRLVCINNTMLIWQYPPAIFGLFKTIYIMTYLFEGTILKSYFDANRISYEKRSIKKIKDNMYEIVPYYKQDTYEYKELINIYEGSMNNNLAAREQKPNALSSSWFSSKQNSNYKKQLKNNIYNFYRNVTKACADDFLWTTFIKQKHWLQGKGYSKDRESAEKSSVIECFIAHNCRATNRYRNKYNLVYAVNKYLHPAIVSYFRNNSVEPNQDDYALSEMLQWIFRSRLRDGKPINIYVPSRRMRLLLMNWLNNNEVK